MGDLDDAVNMIRCTCNNMHDRDHELVLTCVLIRINIDSCCINQNHVVVADVRTHILSALHELALAFWLIVPPLCNFKVGHMRPLKANNGLSCREPRRKTERA
jgi:hypothetical protein